MWENPKSYINILFKDSIVWNLVLNNIYHLQISYPYQAVRSKGKMSVRSKVSGCIGGK